MTKEKHFVSPMPTTTTATTGESITINMSKPTKQAENIFVTGLTIEKPQQTKQQVLKKFEELGYKKYNPHHRDYIELRNEEKCERICIDLDIKTYMKMDTGNLIIPVDITLQEHQLLHELFTVWGWFDE